MWKKLLSLAILCFLSQNIMGENLCDKPCQCEDSDEMASMLTVSCAKSGLTSVPPVASWPGNTYTMDLSRNNITALESLEHFETIRIMKMQYCQLKLIKPSAFAEYPNLKQLDISGNLLSDLDKDTFIGIQALKVLNMSDNNIRKLPNDIFEPLVLLEELKLNGNPLRYLEMNVFKPLDFIIRLDISNIGAHSLVDGIFHSMAHLQVLDLSRNEFEEVPDSALKSAMQLKELYFNENKIKEINEDSFKDLTQLELLELSDLSALTIVKHRAFSTLRSLKVLKMKSNGRLSHIQVSAFDGIYNPADISTLQLKEINLRNNRLSTLDGHILPWCEIHTIDLQGNPWFCDCYMKWILNCSFPAEFSTDLRCRGPKKLEGKYMKELYLEDFVCIPQLASNPYSQAQVRTVAAITGLVLALVIAIALVLFLKRRNIKSWWFYRRRGQGAIYYVKAHTNPTENADL